ncbi:MAG TPA: AraC family transcriptional regulator [Terriglobales bacterium]
MAVEATLTGGSFYGAVQQRQESCGAIFTDLRHACARKLPAHAHELPFFAVILDGDYAEHYGRQHHFFGPFSVSFRPAGIPHQDEVGPHGVRFFEIEIRPEWRTRLAQDGRRLDAARDDFTGGELLWLAMKLFRETRGPVSEGDLNVESLLAELLAEVGMAERKTKDAPAWMARVVAKIHEEYCQRLTLAALSEEAGVHPVHLSRVFRKCKGEGIGEYVHRLRIRAACEQLLKPEASLVQISCDTGFADQSHFTRTFGQLTGMSPARFREMLYRPSQKCQWATSCKSLSPHGAHIDPSDSLSGPPSAHTSVDTAVPGNRRVDE